MKSNCQTDRPEAHHHPVAATWGAVALLLLFLAGCGVRQMPVDEAKAAGKTVEDFTPASYDYFHDMDALVDPASGEVKPPALNEEEIKGRNAWMLWTGGNEAFWDWLARHGYGSMDLLRLIDSRERDTRFARAGVFTEPGTRLPTDQETNQAYGVRYDRPENPAAEQPDPRVYGYSSGVVGLRLFPNPEFTGTARSRWNAERYYTDPDYAARPDTIRPYRVGMSCAFCHAAPHPLQPPENPAEPQWANLSGSIGNQYLRPRAVFGNRLEENNTLYHVLDSQMPGTIDTSLVASDNINNANTMNAVFGLGWRVARATHNPPETLSPESAIYPGLWTDRGPEQFNANPRPVPRVLVDGSDSVGSWIALARVYLNIGTYHQQWVRLHNPFLGFRPQQPFKLADCEANSVYWQATKIRVDPMTAYFLKVSDPMRLKDAPRGSELGGLQGEGVPWDPAYKDGREAFASGCIACHSSIQPGNLPELEANITLAGYDPQNRAALQLSPDDLARLTRGDGQLPANYALWAAQAVERPEFWQRNYLSTDLRIPVTLTRTNSARAMATNARHGQMWEDFASLTYKELDSVGRIHYRDPFSGAERSFEAPSGGPGYYRVPTLISAWATAPFLHNNALGKFNNDPSVPGRLEAYDDAIHKLLWPERRLLQSDHAKPQRLQADQGLIWRTSVDSSFMFRGPDLPVLLSGLTGWSPFWVRLLPWIPALFFLLLGLGLILRGPVTPGVERPRGRPTWWKLSWYLLRNWAFVLVLLAALVSLVVAWRAAPTLAVFEMMLGWSFPWLRAQAYLPFVLLLGLLLLTVNNRFVLFAFYPRLPQWYGAICLVAALLVSLGLGRFGAGLGGGVRFGPFPAGVPINAIANMDPDAPVAARKAAIRALAEYVRDWHASPPGNKPGLAEFEQRVAPKLMAASKCPDLVLDRGHDYEFIGHWSDEEKEALIELLKTF
ncbi:MAG: hypothetical protein J5I93_14340 [Pirellulaceae bacterium]|nr:hypothetical protein [Pirellulaceae bacterium]